MAWYGIAWHDAVAKVTAVRLNGEEKGDGISILREWLMVLQTVRNQQLDVSTMATKQRSACIHTFPVPRVRAYLNARFNVLREEREHNDALRNIREKDKDR